MRNPPKGIIDLDSLGAVSKEVYRSKMKEL